MCLYPCSYVDSHYFYNIGSMLTTSIYSSVIINNIGGVSPFVCMFTCGKACLPVWGQPDTSRHKQL